MSLGALSDRLLSRGEDMRPIVERAVYRSAVDSEERDVHRVMRGKIAVTRAAPSVLDGLITVPIREDTRGARGASSARVFEVLPCSAVSQASWGKHKIRARMEDVPRDVGHDSEKLDEVPRDLEDVSPPVELDIYVVVVRVSTHSS